MRAARCMFGKVIIGTRVTSEVKRVSNAILSLWKLRKAFGEL